MTGGRTRKSKVRSHTITGRASNGNEQNMMNDGSEFQSKKRCKEHSTIDASSRINSSIITTKRLTIGVRGIFGNARSSNSVYREIQNRLENRKLSNEVSSEIEHNLSRIIPNRKCECSKDNVENKDVSSKTFLGCSNNDTGFQTPGNTSTPISTGRDAIRCFSSANRSVESTKPRSVSSASVASVSNGNKHSKTPRVTSQFSKIAEDIVNSIPKFKIFKGFNHLCVLKEDLKKIHSEKHTLTVVPKFQKEDFSQHSEETPVSKKACVDDLKQQQQQKEGIVGLFKEIQELHDQGNTAKHFVDEERMCADDGFCIQQQQQQQQQQQHHPISLEERLNMESKIPYDEKQSFPVPSISTGDYSLITHAQINTRTNATFPFDSLSSSQALIGPNPQSRVIDLFSNNQTIPCTNIFEQPNVQQILRQPISSLRRNRRHEILLTKNFDTRSTIEHSDLLDYIDSIPIGTLENQLLTNRESNVDPHIPSVNNRQSNSCLLGKRSRNIHIPSGQSNSCLLGERNLDVHIPSVESNEKFNNFDLEHKQKLHHHMSIEIKKPSLRSPSPPKLYRMSMF